MRGIEAGRREAGRRVHLVDEQLALRVEEEVHPRQVAAAQHVEGLAGELAHLVGGGDVDARRHVQHRAVLRQVLGRVVVERVRGGGGDLAHHGGHHVAAHLDHTALQLAALDAALHQHGVVVLERGGQGQRQRGLVVRGPGADRRAERGRLHEQARAQALAQPRVGGQRAAAAMQPVRHHRQAGLQQQALGHLLVHRRRAGEHARADVGHATGLEQALQPAVLAERAVQGRERDVDAGQLAGDVARFAGHQLAAAARCERDGAGVRVDGGGEACAREGHVAPRTRALDADGHHPVAGLAQHRGERGGRAQRDLVLGGAPAEEQAHGDGRVGAAGVGLARQFERELLFVQVESPVVGWPGTVRMAMRRR